jgi:hypothetical protein
VYSWLNRHRVLNWEIKALATKKKFLKQVKNSIGWTKKGSMLWPLFSAFLPTIGEQTNSMITFWRKIASFRVANVNFNSNFSGQIYFQNHNIGPGCTLPESCGAAQPWETRAGGSTWSGSLENASAEVAIRVTGLGEFSPIGWLLTFASL